MPIAFILLKIGVLSFARVCVCPRYCNTIDKMALSFEWNVLTFPWQTDRKSELKTKPAFRLRLDIHQTECGFCLLNVPKCNWTAGSISRILTMVPPFSPSSIKYEYQTFIFEYQL